MEIILVRHGNTFAPTDKVVWAGARTDLSLVEKGRHQAALVATALKERPSSPAKIYTGPLKRTLETAEIIAEACSLPSEAIVKSNALREIYYGSWEGRSNDEIRSEVGDAAIDGWQQDSIWPRGFGWSPDEVEIISSWASLIFGIERDNPPDATGVIVSSNGIFRVIAKTLGIPARNAKMATGAMATLRLNGGRLDLVNWNVDPTREVD